MTKSIFLLMTIVLSIKHFYEMLSGNYSGHYKLSLSDASANYDEFIINT